MAPPIPPLPSPGQPFVSDREREPTTGEFLAASVENVVREQTTHVEKNVRRGVSERLTVSFVASVVVAIGTAFGAYTFVLNEAKAQTDAGVKLIDQKAEATQGELTRYKSENDARFNRLEHQGDRNEQKLDAMLNAFRVPNPAPAPKDGGTP